MTTSKDLQRHYDGYYDNEDREWRRLGALGKADNIIRAWNSFKSSRPGRVIELGCGDGAVAQRLYELGFCDNYRGFDISTSGISHANERNLPNFSFNVSGLPIPAEDGSADLVYLSHVVEHLEHPRELIAEAHRIAPVLIVEVPLELNRGLSPDYDWDPVGHINKYNRMAIRQLIQTCRYDVKVQFTTQPSREIVAFTSPGTAGTLKWAVKATALKIAPALARSQFTYHETLLATRNYRAHSN